MEEEVSVDPRLIDNSFEAKVSPESIVNIVTGVPHLLTEFVSLRRC